MHGGIPFPIRHKSRSARSDFRLQRSHFTLGPLRRQLLALGLARGAKAETLHHEGMVVLLLALFVGPKIGADLGLNNELITLARMSGNRLPETLEGDEPEAGNRFSRIAVGILACVIVAHQANSRVRRIAFDSELRILGKIAHGGKGEAVHVYSLKCCVTRRCMCVAWNSLLGVDGN